MTVSRYLFVSDSDTSLMSAKKKKRKEEKKKKNVGRYSVGMMMYTRSLTRRPKC